MSRWNFLYISLCSLCVVCSLDIAEKMLAAFFKSFYRIFMHISKIHNYAPFYPLCSYTVYNLQS